jgi:uncharacterized protein (UPF0335 family)
LVNKISEEPTAPITKIGGNAAPALLSFVARIERLAEETAALSDDRKEVFAEAKSQGFDAATLRRVIAIRKMDTATYVERCALIDTYLEALRSAEKRQFDQSVKDAV